MLLPSCGICHGTLYAYTCLTMQVDFLTLACLRDFLDAFLGARVQHVLLADERSVGLELYAGQRLYLLASAVPQIPRILLTPGTPRRGVAKETPMLLLLRKWVRGGRLVDVVQPSWERILLLGFSGHAGDCRLVVELVGRYSNVVLVGPDGNVLDAVKHVGPGLSRYRVTLPGQPYQLPPLPPNRVPPTEVSIADWDSRLSRASTDENLHSWLVGQLLGVSPVVGREIAARATGDSEACVTSATPEALAEAVAELFAPLENGWWAPHVALDPTGSVTAFTSFEPQQFERVEPVRNIGLAMWRFFEARGLADPYAAARQSVQALIDRVATRFEKRLRGLKKQVIDGAEVNELRTAGELLLTYQDQVVKGAQAVTVIDYSGAPRTIPINPMRTPVENAQTYFRRYEKTRRAAERIPALIDAVRVEQAFLEQMEADLTLAESRPEIDAVRSALSEAGWTQGRFKGASLAHKPRRYEIDGFPILVGRNARQNEYVTFKRAAPEDLWLHVRGMPGAHVVIKRVKKRVPDQVVQRAAEFAAFYSRARGGGGKVSVDVTERRFVRRVGSRFPGMVTYRNERTIFASTEPKDFAEESQ